MIKTLSLILPLAALFLASFAQAEMPPEPATVRVGVLAYDDASTDLSLFSSTAQQLAKSSAKPISIKVAFGSYPELLHWTLDEKIDVAVVNAEIFRAIREDPTTSRRWRYAFSVAAPESAQGIICFGKKGVGPESFDAIGDAQIILVDPHSVSGTLIPLAALKQRGITPNLSQLRYSYSHSNSIRLVSASTTPAMACVWKGAHEKEPHDDLVPFEADTLQGFTAPLGMVIARRDSVNADTLVSTMASRPEFRVESDWEHTLDNVAAWRDAVKPLLGSSDKASLNDLVTSLANDFRTQPTPPRLALVLAGGGAKCSYQVGALRALEESLATARERLNLPTLDINLVVGTSGGAINSIPAAMAIAKTEAGYQDLVDAWLDLDQREILLPSKLVRANLSLWLYALETLLIVIPLGFNRANWYKQPFLPSRAALIFGPIQIAIGLAPIKPWDYLGLHENLHRIWLWFSYGVLGAGILHVLTGLIALFLARKMHLPRRKTCTVGLIILAVLLPIVQAWTMLFHQETLVEGLGIQSSVLRSFSRIAEQSAKRDGISAWTPLTGDSTEERLSDLGTKVVNQGLLKRDLVFATSPLTNPQIKLPGEYYWYYSPSPSNPPNYNERGVSLREHAPRFFDVLMGSGSIYPVFPARRIFDFPEKGLSVDLVDGSFAHRSPLEAATLWGATHVIVIEASTSELPQRGSLLANVGASLSYLYDEAQLTDVRARSQVNVFTLTPEAPHIGLLDFADNLIAQGIEKGYREARGEVAGKIHGAPTFDVTYGEPKFWTP